MSELPDTTNDARWAPYRNEVRALRHELAEAKGRAEKAEAEVNALMSEWQRLQPAGSPPHGGPSTLAHWIRISTAERIATLESEIEMLRGQLLGVIGLLPADTSCAELRAAALTPAPAESFVKTSDWTDEHLRHMAAEEDRQDITINHPPSDHTIEKHSNLHPSTR